MSRFPLCEKAFPLMKCYEPNAGRGEPFYYYRAADLEAKLASAPVVYVENHANFGWSGQEKNDSGDWIGTEATHSARLLLVEPIAKDTAESLLRELVENAPAWTNLEFDLKFIGRAKKVLSNS